MSYKTNNWTPGLYICSMPIGCDDDITLRALELFRHADIILCEDTRIFYKQYQRYAINTTQNSMPKIVSYHDHNEDLRLSLVKQFIQEGRVVALVSDAGTPLLSDPGFRLVRFLKTHNMHVTCLPGACSVIAALIMSGFPPYPFFFGGFLPRKNPDRLKLFQFVHKLDATSIFFETAKRLSSSLECALDVFSSERQACIARELTKKFENVDTDTIKNIYKKANDNHMYYRGEIVLLIEPAKESKKDIHSFEFEEAHLQKSIRALLPFTPPKKIAESLSVILQISKNDMYKIVLKVQTIISKIG